MVGNSSIKSICARAALKLVFAHATYSLDADGPRDNKQTARIRRLLLIYSFRVSIVESKYNIGGTGIF